MFTIVMILLSTAVWAGLLYLATALWIFRCSLRPGAVVYMAPDEGATVYYVCDGEEKYMRYKFLESRRHPGWFALKKGGYARIRDVKSIAAIEYECAITDGVDL